MAAPARAAVGVCSLLVLLAFTTLDAQELLQSAPDSSGEDASGPDGIWSGAVSLGYAHGLGEDFASVGSVSVAASGWYAGWLGVEGGYHALGTETTVVLDLYGPGTSQRGSISRSFFQATVEFAVRRSTGKLRAYGIAGAGAYFVRTKDEIQTRDPSGVRVRESDFVAVRTEANPGFNIGAGMVHDRTFGRVSLGFDVRWHGIVAVSTALEFPSFLTFGATVTMR